MRIDVHAHYYPPEYAELLVSMGRPDAAHAAQRADLTARIAVLDGAGVDVQVLSSVAFDVAVADQADQIRAAAFINDAYQALSDSYGGRFRFFAQVPLPDTGAAIAEAKRCLELPGCVGVNLPPQVRGEPIDRPAFAPFWAELDQLRAVVYIHPESFVDSRYAILRPRTFGVRFGYQF